MFDLTKKITHFGKYYLPDLGGVESVTVSLASGAARNGYSVTVVCFSKNREIKNELIANVKIKRSVIKKLFSGQPISFDYILKCILESRTSCLVHMHAPNFLALICSLFLPARVKLIVHWHSDVLNKGILGKILMPLEFLLLRRANCIIATSQKYADSSKALRRFKNKIKIVPIGVRDIPRDAENILFLAKQKVATTKKRVILSVGRLVPYKGFDALIRAAPLISEDTTIVIAGDGPERERLSKSVIENNVQDRVFLVGRLSEAELISVFKEASLFCLPSTYRAEAFGVVLVEAMAHGIPIVSCNIPGSGVSWVNKEGVSGINVPIGNAAEIANACNKILDDVELREKLSRGARNRYLKLFTEERSLDSILSIYRELLDDR